MNIQLSGQNIEITEALRKYTEEKLQKLLKHSAKITNIAIVFHIDKVRQIAEGQVALPKKNVLHASAESENMYETIDKLVDKLVRQVTKYKEKHSNHHE